MDFDDQLLRFFGTDDLDALTPAALAGGVEHTRQIKDTPAREGRNPSTGATIQIAASKKLTFASAKADKLNG